MGLKKLNLNSKFEIFLGIIIYIYIYIYIYVYVYVYIKTLICSQKTKCIRIYKNSNMFTKNKIYTTTIF